MTQRRQISVHLGMALLIPLKSDPSLMLLSTFIQRQKTFLSYGKICSTSMLSFLTEDWSLNFCSNFLFGNFFFFLFSFLKFFFFFCIFFLYLLGMFLFLLNIGTFVKSFDYK